MGKELCLLRDPMLNVAFEFLPDSLERCDFPIQSVHDFRRGLSQSSTSSNHDPRIDFFRMSHRLTGHLTAPFVLDSKQLRIVHI